MRTISLSVILLSTLHLFGQSGWTKSKGSLFAKLDFSHLSASKYYTPSGNALTTSVFNQTSLNWYGEYGLSDRWTLVSAMPLLRKNAFETSEAVYGIGDLRLEIKYRLLKDFPVTLSIAPEFPTGRRNAFAASKSDPLDKINLPTGDGEFNVWSTLAASQSFGKLYGTVYGAYNYRTQYEGLDFRDLYQFGVEVGVNPLSGLWVNAKVRSQFSTGDSIYPELGFVRGDATTYTLYSFEAFYKLNDRIGVSGTFLSGGDFIAPFKNIYIAPYFSLGIVYEKK